MPDERSTLDQSLERSVRVLRRPPAPLPRVAAWPRESPDRAGEGRLTARAQTSGRGGQRPEDGAERVRFQQQRPGARRFTEPFESLRVSRLQLRLVPHGDVLVVESIGVCPLLVNGERVERAEVKPGDTLQLERVMVFLVARRPDPMPELASLRLGGEVAFGAADPFGC